MVVVIAIIGVLLALTAPLFSSFLESARKTACMANLTTATRTLEFYEVVENRTLTPDVIDTIMKDSMGADPTSSGYRGICPSGGFYNVTVGRQRRYQGPLLQARDDGGGDDQLR